MQEMNAPSVRAVLTAYAMKLFKNMIYFFFRGHFAFLKETLFLFFFSNLLSSLIGLLADLSDSQIDYLTLPVRQLRLESWNVIKLSNQTLLFTFSFVRARVR